MTRIHGHSVDLEPSAVRDFFERRGRSINAAHPITSVIYQDQNPELAAQRDAFEKRRVLPLLQLRPQARVLDVGCGIGRWVDALVHEVAQYHGVDFSESLITAARARHGGAHCSFQVLAAQHVSPAALSIAEPFTHVLISGVLIYLNDAELVSTLMSLTNCCAQGARVYIREPVAIAERLTLVNFPSEELQSDYNAIYRTEAELTAAFAQCLAPAGFRTVLNERLYPEEMNNRRETYQRIFVIEKA